MIDFLMIFLIIFSYLFSGYLANSQQKELPANAFYDLDQNKEKISNENLYDLQMFVESTRNSMIIFTLNIIIIMSLIAFFTYLSSVVLFRGGFFQKIIFRSKKYSNISL